MAPPLSLPRPPFHTYERKTLTSLCALLASRPQLVHSNSKQSVTASDDYYSLTSEGSSNDDRTNFARYQTPPMHIRHEDRDASQSEATIPNIKPIRQKETEEHGADNVDATTTEGQTIKRKPISSSSSEGTVVRRPISGVSPPTPGVDDTPYIQFAIDQLTRDEEVVGSRHQSNGTEPPYPVERIIPTQYHDTRRPMPPPTPPPDDPQPSRKLILQYDFMSSLT